MKHSLRQDGESTRLSFEGDLDMHVAQELRQVLRRTLDEKPHVIVLDMTQVPFVDSSAIATIVEALKLARKQAATLRLESCQESVRDTFEIAGLTQLLGIV
jgi:anti-sigma B factor antagonist